MQLDINILRSINLGNGKSEQEPYELNRWYIDTPLHQKMIEGKTDVILGGRGTGKSALSWALINRARDPQGWLEDCHIVDVFKEYEHFNTAVVDTFRDQRSPGALIEFWKALLLVSGACSLIDDPAISRSGKTRLREIVGDGLLKFEQLPRLRRAWELALGIVQLNEEPTFARLSAWGEESRQALSLLEDVLIQEKRKCWVLVDSVDEIFKGHSDEERLSLFSLIEATRSINTLSESRTGRIKVKAFLRSDALRLVRKVGPIPNLAQLRADTVSWDRQGLQSMLLSRLSESIFFSRQFGHNEGSTAVQACLPTLTDELPTKLITTGVRDAWNFLLSYSRNGLGEYTPRYILWMFERARLEAIDDLNRKHTFRSAREDNNRICLVACHHLSQAYVSASRLAFDEVAAEYPEVAALQERCDLKRGQLSLAELDSTLRVAFGSETDSVREAIEASAVGRIEQGRFSLGPIFMPAFKIRSASH